MCVCQTRCKSARVILIRFKVKDIDWTLLDNLSISLAILKRVSKHTVKVLECVLQPLHYHTLSLNIFQKQRISFRHRWNVVRNHRTSTAMTEHLINLMEHLTTISNMFWKLMDINQNKRYSQTRWMYVNHFSSPFQLYREQSMIRNTKWSTHIKTNTNAHKMYFWTPRWSL